MKKTQSQVRGVHQENVDDDVDGHFDDSDDD